jgi:hypothetical protein
MVKQYNIPTHKLKKARKVQNVDGTTNRLGSITQKVDIMTQYNNAITLHQFLVADIGEDQLILGYPFFEATNPKINWKEGTLPEPIILSVQND